MTEPGARPAAGSDGRLRPPVDRLYGRQRGHRLRPRQQALLDIAMPRLRLDPARAADPRSAFAAPPDALWLEIGFGGGEHARAQVAANPGAALIAAEVFENGLCSMLSALVGDGDPATAPLPGNLRLWPADARTLLRLLPDGALDRVFLLFPDPWPKARHARRRFVHPAMLPVVARVLRPGGEWRIASDDPTYQDWVRVVFSTQAAFELAVETHERPQDWPATRYEAKARRAGRTPVYWTLRRR